MAKISLFTIKNILRFWFTGNGTICVLLLIFIFFDSTKTFNLLKISNNTRRIGLFKSLQTQDKALFTIFKAVDF